LIFPNTTDADETMNYNAEDSEEEHFRNIKKVKKEHQIDQTFECGYCAAEFPNKYNMSRHVLKVHKIPK
jgi:hypothetical protein